MNRRGLQISADSKPILNHDDTTNATYEDDEGNEQKDAEITLRLGSGRAEETEAYEDNETEGRHSGGKDLCCFPPPLSSALEATESAES